jgi:hypothetical protein
MDESGKSADTGSTGLNWALIKRMLIPALIALYLILGMAAIAWLLLDISTGQFRFFNWLGVTLPDKEEYVVLLKLVCYAGLGGALGGITYGMMNLQKHTAVEYDFRPAYAGDYVFRPFGAAALAVVIYALLRGGVLTILGGDPASTSTSVVATFSAFGIGFLAGFGSKQVTYRLDELIKNVFGTSDEPKEPRDRREEDPTGK